MKDWTPWTTEAAMVADFSAWARHHGWTVYAETAGWDVLLVRQDDGFQVGVEAKLSLNAKVLSQVVESDHPYGKGVGPDCWAVLVPRPKLQLHLADLARRLAIVVISGSEPRRYHSWAGPTFEPNLPRLNDSSSNEASFWGCWPQRCPDARHPLPDYVPDVTGGHSAPVKLTDWKVRALKVAVLLEMRGAVTRDDFRALGIDHRRWTDHWLASNGRGGWVGTDATPNFAGQHPVNYAQIKADAPEWMKGLPGLALFTRVVGGAQ